MGKKGLSFDEKRQRMLKYFYTQREVLTLKELEKNLPKAAQIVSQSVKEVLQSLVDDGLVDFDKIGAGNFYWALPSSAQIKRKNLETQLRQKLEILHQKKAELMEKKERALKERRPSAERQEKLKRLEESRDKLRRIKESIREYEERGPGKLRKLEEIRETCVQAANRWTDNIFAVKNKILEFKPDMTASDFQTIFGLDPELDYLE
eukprot:TRINITY_DN7614_c0_g1_i1.p1 TRINITY_DN7614_c0_g1~~TRINITY_DN7614_c0_g1_i1.p1  ORF type:complete len:206 (-),score=72.12 TRINITY_DN7614_c0_g1_i1:88-705(-)